MVDREEGTPPTGTAIPRPRPKPPPIEALPVNRSIEDIYKLIDERLPTEIITRISSMPPSKPEPPRQSLPVRAAKHTSKWTAYLLAALMVIGQLIATASQPEYRGPIVQATKLIVMFVAEALKDDPAALPEPAAGGGAGGAGMQ